MFSYTQHFCYHFIFIGVFNVGYGFDFYHDVSDCFDLGFVDGHLLHSIGHFILVMHICYVSLPLLNLVLTSSHNKIYLMQLMALLLLRHALSVTDSDADDDPSTFFSVSHFSFFCFSSFNNTAAEPDSKLCFLLNQPN